MKTIITLCLALTTVFVTAQQDTSVHRKTIVYKIKLTDIKGKTIKGYLAGFTDSSMLMLPYDFSQMKGTANRHAIFDQYLFQDIAKVSARRKKATGRGIGFGALTGLGAGIITGLISGEKSYISKGENYWFWSVPAGTKVVTESTSWAVARFSTVFSLSGLVIGGAIGVFSTKHYEINGSKEKFDDMKYILLGKMYH